MKALPDELERIDDTRQSAEHVVFEARYSTGGVLHRGKAFVERARDPLQGKLRMSDAFFERLQRDERDAGGRRIGPADDRQPGDREHGADTRRLASLDVVELNPAFDVHNRTAALAVDLIESLFGKSTLVRRPVWNSPAQASPARPREPSQAR